MKDRWSFIPLVAMGSPSDRWIGVSLARLVGVPQGLVNRSVIRASAGMTRLWCAFRRIVTSCRMSNAKGYGCGQGAEEINREAKKPKKTAAERLKASQATTSVQLARTGDKNAPKRS